MRFNHKQTTIIYIIIVALCFIPFIEPSYALIIGILFSLLNIKHRDIHKFTSKSLQYSIILMGFGMNLTQVISASKSGFIYTATSVVLVMTVGILLGKILQVEKKTTLLISSGTAICGGSAIAAVSPIIEAENYQISFSLIVVFVLNGVALILFPILGHYFNMSQESFGNWAAIAIHDTSSVVGAGAAYGDKALEVATTVKLIRALWIIPLSIVIALLQNNKSAKNIKIPWFILYFVIAILVAHFIPLNHNIYSSLHWLGKRGMVIALFFIGSNMSIDHAKEAGVKSFLLGIILWIITGVASFIALRG